MIQAAQSPMDILLSLLRPLPSLGALASLFEESEAMNAFVDLIAEYVPDKRNEIMANNETGDKIATFFNLFSERYFPLDDSWVQSIWENGFDEDDEISSLFDGLVRFIPVQVRNFAEDGYHFFENEIPGRKLMLALLKCPTGSPDSRIPLVEAAREIVGKKLADMMPAQGFTRQRLHTLLDGTRYAGLAEFSDWVNHETGFWALDLDSSDMDFFDMPSWEREQVEKFTREQPLIDQKLKRINELGEWLSDNPAARFKKLLSALLQKKISPKTFNGDFQ